MTWFTKNYAAVVIALIVIASLASIATRRAQEEPPGTIVLRIGHWQLEPSVRAAFNIMAADYRKLHPNVRVVQDAIPEMVYGPWTTTQLMGGTAPDLLEVGLGVLPRHLWLQYYNRYCYSLSQCANEPNPCNAATDLAGVPLRSTIKDGMRWTYIEEMQEYVAIPLAQFGVRIFYNRELLKKLTGLEEPPADYRAFLSACRQIRQQKDRTGEPYTPIAASKYHIGMWEAFMLDGITYPAIRKADFNRDGLLGADESYVAFRAGLLSLRSPPYRARLQMLRELTEQFQTGFAGLTRDEAVFQFVQQRAVFMTTGTWDARGLQEQAGGQFTVSVMDFPRPGKDDPEYGSLVEGPQFEQPYVGFAFAITHTTKNFEVALDFLRFLASKRQNEKLNKIVGWIPSVKGTELDPLLKAFEPHLEGVINAFTPTVGGETWLKWTQLYSLYQVGQISYEDLVNQYEPFYKEHGYQDFMEQQRDWRRGMQLDEQMLAGLRSEALLGNAARWGKYRSLVGSRQVTPEINRARQIRLIENGPRDKTVGPYDYSPAVLKKIRGQKNPAA